MSKVEYSKEEKYVDSVKALNKLRTSHNRSWVPYFLGTPILYGPTKVFVHKGVARRRMISYISLWGEPIKDYEDIVDRLEKYKMLEFRQLGDLSPLFPHSVDYITDEQADRLKMMVNSDGEMVQLALTILEGLQNKENE